MKKSLSILALLSLISTQAFAVIPLNGAGATFPYPLYSKWFDQYHKEKSEVQVNYNSIGSGGGIKALLEKTVDFGASDSPMTDEELNKSPAAIYHVPTVMGAVVLSYNLPELKKPLVLDGGLVADIYLGNIKKWNDPKIAALNKGVTLPETDILATYRSDGSGTTAIFTEYLAKINADWKTKVGAGKSVAWPTGLAGKGNEGVAGLVKQTPGAIGYVELVYAASNNLSTAELKNKAGKVVAPNLKSVTAAAAGAKIPADFRISAKNSADFRSSMSITDSSGKDAYPISSFTYLLVYSQMEKAKGKSVQELVNWTLGSEAQKLAEPLNYAPLPAKLLAKVKTSFKALELK